MIFIPDFCFRGNQRLAAVLILACVFPGTRAAPSTGQTSAAQTSTAQTLSSSRVQQDTGIAVAAAFRKMHNGWSPDEVILQDDLNEAFIAHCLAALGSCEKNFAAGSTPTADELNWTLMNLRKAGKLKTKTTKRKKVDTAAVRHLAEIATRNLLDRHQCSIDRIMCQADLRAEFDSLVRAIDDSADAYTVRKAAFQLRKARRLKPELITRIADWGRTIQTFSIEAVRQTPELINKHPGIYIFRDSTGYLYIGQTDNLQKRLQTHLDESHNRSLATYLKSASRGTVSVEVHDFDPDSKAANTMVRRAYESALIESRQPRFNVQP